MATVQTRPFSRDYSGLINQSVLAVCILTICVTSYEWMKRRRRGHKRVEGLGSVESWKYGYLYQGRSWARKPSPPHPQGWPLSWTKEVVTFPEKKFIELRGVDATLYCRFIRGCFWFTLLQSFTTTVILLPIHLSFSDTEYSPRSMNRALISSLVGTTKGLSLLPVHLCLLLWVSISWILTILWICRGAFAYRAAETALALQRVNREAEAVPNSQYTPHPHPQHPFHAMPPLHVDDQADRGLRLRTVMVTNIPTRLRSEKDLKEYFEYYMSRPMEKPSIGLTSSTQPSLLNRMVTKLINRIRRLKIFASSDSADRAEGDVEADADKEDRAHRGSKPIIQYVVIARKMTELASLLDRREDVLRRLETAHINLARKALEAVKEEMRLREFGLSRRARMADRLGHLPMKIVHRSGTTTARSSADEDLAPDIEQGNDEDVESESRMDLLIRTLGPFVEEFDMRRKRRPLKNLRVGLRAHHLKRSHLGPPPDAEQAGGVKEKHDDESDTMRPTIWETLFSLPRPVLDAYQPLVHLSKLFRGRTVPATDYYTAKVKLLTSLIAENRGRPLSDFEAVSTAFVTFQNPEDARWACKYLAVHPKNPLACLVAIAPEYEDLDWIRVMKSTFKAEIVKDWVVNVGVWVFTIAWIIPVSLLVALVTIKNIAVVLPGLDSFLERHEFLQEVISSLLPTLFMAILMLLVPPLLLLIAKKAHTINTLSALHDRIMTRYHKFLVANVLVFFCVGVSSLESFFTSFKTSLNVLTVVGEAFPSAGPFYVGWFIFATAIHAGTELGLFGLPLLCYPSTRRQRTPRKREVGIRPRTFNYYYWLPNHVLVVIITLVFAVLNPLLTPFAAIYFCFELVVVKNQLLHVYAKNYEGNGRLMLIRLVRYPLDGLILAQVCFLGFSAVTKKTALVAVTAIMIAFTILTKLILTRICRSKFEEADIHEARLICGSSVPADSSGTVSEIVSSPAYDNNDEVGETAKKDASNSRFRPWRLARGLRFTYSEVQPRARSQDNRKPIPFEQPQFSRLHSWDGSSTHPIVNRDRLSQAAGSMPDLRNGTTPSTSPNQLQMQALPKESPTPLAGQAENSRTPLVTRHDKHPAWDDFARFDRPYDNPYYTRPVTNHLWLPRDPVGILDLDDTVNVYKSLTTDSSLGQLGERIDEGFPIDELPSPIASTISEDLEGNRSVGSVTGMARVCEPEHMLQVTGEEDIDLPSTIAERVENIEKEDQVDHAVDGRSHSSILGLGSRRHSVITQHSSNHSIPQRRSSRLSPLGPGGTVESPGLMPSTARRRGSVLSSESAFSQAASRRRGRSASMIVDPAAQPDLHAQARFVRARMSHSVEPGTESTVPTLLPVQSSGRIRSGSMATTRGSAMVTTRDAVVNEVIAEEYQATEERLRVEEVEAVQAAAPESRSWLTSWLFARTDHDG